MKKEKIKKEQRYYNNLAVDSEEEVLILQWLEELMECGFVTKIERAETFVLSERFTNTYEETKELKTKSKVVEKEQVILEKHVYTPEFKITIPRSGVRLLSWSKHNDDNGSWVEETRKFDKLFMHHCNIDGEYEVYLEIKPEWDQNNMERLFKINRAWMYQKHGIYVNLVKPLQLFEKTFTPKKYLKTATGKDRIIHFKTRTLDEFIINQ